MLAGIVLAFLWFVGPLLALAVLGGGMFLIQWTVRVAIDEAISRRAARRESGSQCAAP